MQQPQASTSTGRGAPDPALLLGLAGLVPFVVGAVMAILETRWHGITGADILLTYGAVILSFLGGTQWGASLRDQQLLWPRYGYAVLPALIAWPALLLERDDGLVVLVGGFAFVYVLDEWMRYRGWLPGWYLRLRRLLTAVVLACLAVTLGGSVGTV